MTPPADSPSQLPPDEESYYAAWMGRMWPRYRRLFETADEGFTGFEWRSAVHPLWLLGPGLRIQVLVVALVAAAAASPAAAGFGSGAAGLGLMVLAVAVLLVFWPLVLAGVILAAATEGAATVWLWAAGMLATSLAVGRMTPRWLVREGRRRWGRHAELVAAGGAPSVPRSLTAASVPRIAVLVALAVGGYLLLMPHSHPTREKAYVATMKSDLRNLVAVQETFFADSQRYAANLDSSLYLTSYGVSVRLLAASDSGYSAVATHPGTATTCGIFVGPVPPPVPDALEGEPRCVSPR